MRLLFAGRFATLPRQLNMETGYQNMLRRELVDRLARNSAYSARAMARDVGLSAPFFCQVLNASRGLTETRAFDIADKLGWDPDKTRRFVTLLRFEKAKDEPSRKKILSELNQWEQVEIPRHGLEAAVYQTISSWVHYAILELTTIEGFVPKAQWIAKRLGQTIVDTEAAIRRLRTLGLLVTEGGTWKKAHESYSTPDDKPAFKAAIRQFHDGVLQLSRRKLWVEQAQREFGSIVVCTDPDRMPEIKRRIRRFQEEMMAYMEEAPRKAVYQMSIQFFRLDGGESPTEMP
jgi:uncharacterized protein (TIGR02147 family)